LKVATPGLGEMQVAVLQLHVEYVVHVTSAPYSCERGERITQMHRFFLAQNDYLCCLMGELLGEANFGELRQETVRKGSEEPAV
jgi:hypothetical protein